ncbi:hypothetical protein R3P38DRAFT_3547171 [Favolaschia claudopus]|uniref:Uncharacterized protein n=1 Tax=Favolaschia claudopus TaxID=2862362 RepID=A0AAW0E2N5_9AGAR
MAMTRGDGALFSARSLSPVRSLQASAFSCNLLRRSIYGLPVSSSTKLVRHHQISSDFLQISVILRASVAARMDAIREAASAPACSLPTLHVRGVSPVCTKRSMRHQKSPKRSTSLVRITISGNPLCSSSSRLVTREHIPRWVFSSGSTAVRTNHRKHFTCMAILLSWSQPIHQNQSWRNWTSIKRGMGARGDTRFAPTL